MGLIRLISARRKGMGGGIFTTVTFIGAILLLVLALALIAGFNINVLTGMLKNLPKLLAVLACFLMGPTTPIS